MCVNYAGLLKSLAVYPSTLHGGKNTISAAQTAPAQEQGWSPERRNLLRKWINKLHYIYTVVYDSLIKRSEHPATQINLKIPR